MNIGNEIAILAIELVVKGNVVSIDNVGSTLEDFRSEISTLVGQIPLSESNFVRESTNFKITGSTPLTFDIIFATPLRRSSLALINRTITTKDQFGKLSTTEVVIDPNGSFFVSVFGQIFRAEYLKRLYSLIESSAQKATLLPEVSNKLVALYATPRILGPVADECYASFDGGIYLYRDTITENSDFFIALNYNELPSQIITDFEFMRSSSLTGLYSLPGYTPGMNTGIEEALTTRGALSKLNDNSKWLNVTSSLNASVEAPTELSTLVAYEAPRVLAFISLARKVSLLNQEISLSELDSNTMKLLKVLRKISDKNELVVLSTNELLHDIIELSRYLTDHAQTSEEFIMLCSKLLGVTTQTVSYEAGVTEAERRLIRLASGQWRYDLSEITGISVSAVGSGIQCKRGTTLLATISYAGPFAEQIATIEVSRSEELQTVIGNLSAVAALIDTAMLSKAFAISPSTGLMTFSYTIDQLKSCVAEILVDTTRSLYKRS